jgi:hypothetical protein
MHDLITQVISNTYDLATSEAIFDHDLDTQWLFAPTYYSLPPGYLFP